MLGDEVHREHLLLRGNIGRLLHRVHEVIRCVLLTCGRIGRQELLVFLVVGDWELELNLILWWLGRVALLHGHLGLDVGALVLHLVLEEI